MQGNSSLDLNNLPQAENLDDHLPNRVSATAPDQRIQQPVVVEKEDEKSGNEVAHKSALSKEQITENLDKLTAFRRSSFAKSLEQLTTERKRESSHRRLLTKSTRDRKSILTEKFYSSPHYTFRDFSRSSP